MRLDPLISTSSMAMELLNTEGIPSSGHGIFEDGCCFSHRKKQEQTTPGTRLLVVVVVVACCCFFVGCVVVEHGDMEMISEMKKQIR